MLATGATRGNRLAMNAKNGRRTRKNHDESGEMTPLSYNGHELQKSNATLQSCGFVSVEDYALINRCGRR